SPRRRRPSRRTRDGGARGEGVERLHGRGPLREREAAAGAPARRRRRRLRPRRPFARGARERKPVRRRRRRRGRRRRQRLVLTRGPRAPAGNRWQPTLLSKIGGSWFETG